MKGIVFTELLDMVESLFGTNMVDDTLDQCELESGGAYTTVGTYDHKEILQILGALSEQTGLPVSDLVYKYGYHLFFRFNEIMPDFFKEPQSAFDFLESVHDYIHVEVKKLYPDAKLPNFETTRNGNTTLTMVYKSRCPFADLAEGLINGCVDFYKETINITSADNNKKGEYSRIFTLMRQ